MAATPGDLERYNAATAHLEPPFAVVDLAAMRANAEAMRLRAAGKPIRLASKSVRCRELIGQVLRMDGFRGILAFTLPEALWLAEQGVSDQILVGYPTADRTALARLAGDPAAAASITVMVDCLEHLDMIEKAAASGAQPQQVRVCMDIDASYVALSGLLRAGAYRSPIRAPGEAAELARRRAAIVAAVRDVAPLEFVNGGGTGSLEKTAAEAAVTEIGAGSGLYQPRLFDSYRGFRGRPAAFFALPVVRKPGRRVVTALGGGYLASGAADRARLPVPYLPPGLRLDGREGAGEVQTPLLGAAAGRLQIGDRVWLRHAKAGELCERFSELHLIDGNAVVATVRTYRGEGRTFL